MRFVNRVDAGRRLAALLQGLRDEPVVVVGLPRGGVPVALEVARALDAPLDVIMVRKLGVPFQPELAMGAIGEDGVRVVNVDVLRLARVSDQELAEVESRERIELERRARHFRGDRPRQEMENRTVIVVDDGVATGSTARAACEVARAHGASRVVMATPVAPVGWTDRLGDVADDFVCISNPDPFFAVGQFYKDFSPTTDDEVVECLARGSSIAGGGRAAMAELPDPPTRDEDVEVSVGHAHLRGHLLVPENAIGMVVFAHGSGSSRHSPRNRYVAQVLNNAGLGTLLFDLLTAEEEVDRANVFDIALLGQRLSDVTTWVRQQAGVVDLPIGYFGASTGAAAALWAAAEDDSGIGAVVSRGGRPDLAAARLPVVLAPTLLVVGGRDDVVLDLNRHAAAQMTCETDLVVVPGATHLFEEPGTLAIAADAACDWFVRHFSSAFHQAS